MSDAPPEPVSFSPRLVRAAMIVALLVGIIGIALGEAPLLAALAETGRWNFLLFEIDVNTVLPAILFLALPVFWFWTSRPVPPSPAASRPVRNVLTAILLAALSLAMSWHISRQRVGLAEGVPIGHLPFAYHDEYSYQFQARTWLAGRIAFPGHDDRAADFSQMHVLTTPTFASRYFPATGLWIAPFEAVGHPIWGHWVCGALVTVLLFLTGCELGGYLTGLLAGLGAALSPALALFSNMLLAHHPTLLGLAVFLYFITRMHRTHGAVSGLCAGTGLAWAALCRPMSAAGFALPWGIWMLFCLVRPGTLPGGARAAGKMALAVGVPLLVGALALAAVNRAITGDPLETPYGLFTRWYTPKHVYGFNNAARGEGRRHFETYRKYDDWATNLTGPDALDNLRARARACASWTWGSVPILMAVAWMLIPLTARDMHRWRLVVCGVLSIHAAHIPYWFQGILQFHYVFESAILLLLILAGATSYAWRTWRAEGRRGLIVWSVLVLLGPLGPMYFRSDSFWGPSRISRELDNLAFSKLRFEAFNRRLDELIGDRPALILIRHDPYDIHIDYVHNRPQLDAPVLRLRSDNGPPDADLLHKLRGEYPDREIWYFDMETGEHKNLSPQD